MKYVHTGAAILILIGAAMLLHGLRMPPLKNAEEFNRRHAELEGPNRSKSYWQLRDEFLTPAYRVQDYGIVLMLFGVLMPVYGRGKNISLWFARRRASTALLGTVAATTMTAVYAGSLLWDYRRGEFPSWADSLAIPFSAIPVIWLILLLWGLVHWLLMHSTPAETFSLKFKGLAWWLALMAAMTAILVVNSVAVGDFWMMLPGSMWLLFYLAIWCNRSAKRAENAEIDI